MLLHPEVNENVGHQITCRGQEGINEDFERYLTKNHIAIDAQTATIFVDNLDIEKTLAEKHAKEEKEALLEIKRKQSGDLLSDSPVCLNENLKYKTMAAYKALQDGDLKSVDKIQRNHMHLAKAKAMALGDLDIEAMEELIMLDNQDKGLDNDRRSNDSEKCDSIRSSKDYWEDINANYG